MDNQSKKHSVWDTNNCEHAMKGELFPLFMSVSRSTTNFDVVSMIGIIVFKGAEFTSGNLKRLLPGSNRLRVVVKPKYCCRVVGESLFPAAIDQFQ